MLEPQGKLKGAAYNFAIGMVHSLFSSIY